MKWRMDGGREIQRGLLEEGKGRLSKGCGRGPLPHIPGRKRKRKQEILGVRTRGGERGWEVERRGQRAVAGRVPLDILKKML
jgi:hypothetical protein